MVIGERARIAYTLNHMAGTRTYGERKTLAGDDRHRRWDQSGAKHPIERTFFFMVLGGDRRNLETFFLFYYRVVPILLDRPTDRPAEDFVLLCVSGARGKREE